MTLTVRCERCGTSYHPNTTHLEVDCLRVQVATLTTNRDFWKEAWHEQRAATGAVAWQWLEPWHRSQRRVANTDDAAREESNAMLLVLRAATSVSHHAWPQPGGSYVIGAREMDALRVAIIQCEEVAEEHIVALAATR